jgi:hypothetical protein
MKELNILQMEEIEGGGFWACLSATAWAVATVAAVAAMETNPVSAALSVAIIAEAVAASAAMVAACT